MGAAAEREEEAAAGGHREEVALGTRMGEATEWIRIGGKKRKEQSVGIEPGLAQRAPVRGAVGWSFNALKPADIDCTMKLKPGGKRFNPLILMELFFWIRFVGYRPVSSFLWGPNLLVDLVKFPSVL